MIQKYILSCLPGPWCDEMTGSYLACLVVPGPGEGAEGGGGVVAVQGGQVGEVTTKTVLTSDHHTVRTTVVHTSLFFRILTFSEIVIKILTSSSQTEFT